MGVRVCPLGSPRRRFRGATVPRNKAAHVAALAVPAAAMGCGASYPEVDAETREKTWMLEQLFDVRTPPSPRRARSSPAQRDPRAPPRRRRRP